MSVAVIPARGGSKRIPGKNIKPFCGKPMITWSIEAAKACGLFEHVIVSTDDAEIAEVARQWGAEVPFMRPEELSNDHAGTTPVKAHAAQWALNRGFDVSAVCCIYATAPFIQVGDLKREWDALNSSDWNYVFTVADFAAPILRSCPQLAARMQLLRSHSITRDVNEMTHAADGPWYYQQIDLGFNYRMTDMQAALGLSQMKRLDDCATKRHIFAKRYDQFLVNLPVATPWLHADSYSGLHLYVVRLKLGQVNKTHRQVKVLA
ncbi:MAG: pseudaminic acid cytidylyltransferase [Gallionellaceae bacterium]|jgi:N-acylneuraminate cytidylyltransferase